MSTAEEAEQELERIVEGTKKSLEWAKETYEEEVQSLEERSEVELSEDKKQKLATNMVEGALLEETRVYTSGEETELEVLAIGHRGVQEGWGQDNVDMVQSYGIARYDGVPYTVVFLNNCSEHVDARDIREAFSCLSTLKAVYSVEESDDLQNVLIARTTDKTEPVTDAETGFPEGPEDRAEIVNKLLDSAELASLTDSLSKLDPESGYPYDFGADLKRIPDANVVDRFVSDDKSTATYTVRDPSVVADDLEGTNLVDENARTPGLTVWADPESHMDLGSGSIADFYGVVSEGSNGNIVMNLVGYHAIAPAPIDEEERADEDADVEEETIGGN